MTPKKIYPLLRYGNLLVVNAAIASPNNTIRKVKLLVDTGSSYTVLRLNLTRSIGYDTQKALAQIKITTAGGIIDVPIIQVSWFSCLGQRIDNFPIVVHNLPAIIFVDGVLGMDFFNRFDVFISPKKAEVRYY